MFTLPFLTANEWELVLHKCSHLAGLMDPAVGCGSGAGSEAGHLPLHRTPRGGNGGLPQQGLSLGLTSGISSLTPNKAAGPSCHLLPLPRKSFPCIIFPISSPALELLASFHAGVERFLQAKEIIIFVYHHLPFYYSNCNKHSKILPYVGS